MRLLQAQNENLLGLPEHFFAKLGESTGADSNDNNPFVRCCNCLFFHLLVPFLFTKYVLLMYVLLYYVLFSFVIIVTTTTPKINNKK